MPALRTDPAMNIPTQTQTASPAHPIETLLAEHRTILAVLSDMEQECALVEQNATLSDSWWCERLRFLDEFDEHFHHAKEEGLLFPALEAAGLSPVSGPTATLRAEHGRSRLWRAAIEEALARRDRLRLLGAVQGFVDLQRQHIAKENQILFPIARRLLSAAVFDAMAHSFAERDRGPAVDAPRKAPHVATRS